MNLNSRNLLLIVAVVTVLTIGGPAPRSMAGAPKQAAALPSVDTFLALEKQ